MRRLCSILLAIAMVMLLTACPDKSESSSNTSDAQEESQQKKKVDKKSANTVLENYMRFLMTGNRGAMKSFYSAALRKKIKATPEKAGVSPVGYSIGEAELSAEKATFKINIFNLNKKEQYFSNDEFNYDIKMEINKLVIDNIEKKKSTELYKDTDALFIREQDKLKGSKVVSLSELPGFISAREASELEQKYKTPNKRFGPCALSPDGKIIVFSSMDKNSFIGILTEEDASEAFSTMKKAAEGQDKQGSQQSQQGGAQGSQGAQQGQEKRKNYKITTVDLLFDCEVRRITFSQDGKQFVVEYTPVKKVGNKTVEGTSRIALYKSESGERQQLKANKQFNTVKCSLTNPYFSGPNELVFRVVPLATANSEERKIRGYWRLDVEKHIATQF